MSRETELLYDEVDVGEDGTLVHRILFWPSEEVTIEFASLTVRTWPVPDRRVLLRGGFFEFRPDADETDDEDGRENPQP